MLTRLKKTVQSWMTTQAATAHRIGLTPNQISGLGVIFGVASGVVYWQAGLVQSNQNTFPYHLAVAVVLLLASGYCDALDGALARLHHEASAAGGFLDSLLDRYVEASVYCGLIIGGLCDPFWGVLALIGSLLTSYARARSEAAGFPMETVGLVERAERLIIIVLASLLSIIWTDAISWSMIFLTVATNVTVLQRTIYFFRKVKPQKNPD
jgi:archaetidylinositol phosphate synthase